jgi:mRNA-degrading endonuclease YafQ of YafQ-DinJ toxin-antitoxin module
VTYRIVYTETYLRRARRFAKRHPEVLGQYEKTLRLMEVNPFHPSLRLHKLEGRLADLHSVSINISYRIVIEFLIEGRTITPVDIGSHDEVY